MATVAAESAVRRRLSGIAFTIQASRPGLWATAVWFYLLPLGRRHVFHETGFWFGLVYVTFPLGLMIYGWNDVADAEVDRFNPRKGTFLFGARGSHSQLARLPPQILVVQTFFAAISSFSTAQEYSPGSPPWPCSRPSIICRDTASRAGPHWIS